MDAENYYANYDGLYRPIGLHPFSQSLSRDINTYSYSPSNGNLSQQSPTSRLANYPIGIHDEQFLNVRGLPSVYDNHYNNMGAPPLYLRRVRPPSDNNTPQKFGNYPADMYDAPDKHIPYKTTPISDGNDSDPFDVDSSRNSYYTKEPQDPNLPYPALSILPQADKTPQIVSDMGTTTSNGEINYVGDYKTPKYWNLDPGMAECKYRVDKYRSQMDRQLEGDFTNTAASEYPESNRSSIAPSTNNKNFSYGRNNNSYTPDSSSPDRCPKTSFPQRLLNQVLANREKDTKAFKVHDANVIAGSFDANTTLGEQMDKLKFKSAILSFQDLTYVIPARRKHFWKKKLPPKIVLDKVSGIFTPGVNAIMGPSGGGKTSLLTVLGGRKDIDVDGLILLDGKPISKNFRNESGFVTQEDILMGTLTVRENMMFSASLRLPSKISMQKKSFIVSNIISELNLEKCADTKVGTELIRGISGGEKKRCNIGVELVILPSLLFLDEPTSGLDAATAITVVQLLKRLSDKGCNIIMSIHQPRFEIFKMFHTLILLSSGKVVFHGLSDRALDYFSTLGFDCEIHNNPADFFLDVIEKNEPPKLRRGNENLRNAITYDYDANDEDYNSPPPDDTNNDGTANLGYHNMPKVNLAQKYAESCVNQNVKDALSAILSSQPTTKSRHNFFQKHIIRKGRTEIYPTTFCQQMRVVSKRTIMNLYRNPQPFLVQAFTQIIYSFIVGTIYFRVSNTAQYGLQNRIGALFFMLMNQVFGNLSAIELFMKERPLYIHESTNGFYRVSVYFLSKLFCDLIPMRFVPVLLVSIIAYWMIGLRPQASHYFIFILSLLCLTSSASSIALLASVSYNTIGVATNYCALYFVFMMVFGGLFVNLRSISYKIRWLQYISIFRYAYNALLINELKDSEFCDPSNRHINATDDPQCVYGNHHLQKQGIPYRTWWNLFSNHVALICIILVFWFMAYIRLLRLKKNAK